MSYFQIKHCNASSVNPEKYEQDLANNFSTGRIFCGSNSNGNLGQHRYGLTNRGIRYTHQIKAVKILFLWQSDLTTFVWDIKTLI